MRAFVTTLVLGWLALATPAWSDPTTALQHASTPQVAQLRIALVIGNGAYDFAPALAAPPHDAALVAGALRRAGFDVDLEQNLDKAALTQALRRLADRAAAAGPEAVVVVYYSGRAFQWAGVNFLTPIDAKTQDQAQLIVDAVRVDPVLSQMSGRANILILDASRDSFAGYTGLAEITARPRTCVLLSQQPGRLVTDGTGAESRFAVDLAAAIARPGPIEDTMWWLQERVAADTGGAQRPWYFGSLGGTFAFTGPAGIAVQHPSGSDPMTGMPSPHRNDQPDQPGNY